MPTFSEAFASEYGEDSLEIHQDAFKEGDRVLIVDDTVVYRRILSEVVESLDGATTLRPEGSISVHRPQSRE